MEEIFPDATVGETALPRMAPEEGERSAPHAGDASTFAHVWGHSVFHLTSGPGWDQHGLAPHNRREVLAPPGAGGFTFLTRYLRRILAMDCLGNPTSADYSFDHWGNLCVDLGLPADPATL